MSERGPLSEALFAELQALVSAAHRGDIHGDQIQRLEQLLRDAEARDLYLELVWESDVLATWAKESEQERLPAVRRPRRATALGFLHSSLRLAGRAVARHPLAAALVVLVAVVPLAAWLASPPSQPQAAQNSALPPGGGQALAGNEGTAASPVARLARTVDCAWAGGREAPEAGDDLAAGQKLVLQSGLAEIIFQAGARMILQGPAMLEVRSRASAVLNRGKLTVTAEGPAKGFEVDSPGMKYTDLGTEFGVLVAQTGEQEVHVFRGRVQAEQGKQQGAGSREQGTGITKQAENAGGSGSPLSAPRSPLVLTANQAIRVAAPDKPIQRIVADKSRFVRELPAPLDLVDILAGGDGTTGKTGLGLDPLTGNLVDAKERFRVRAGRGFHRVAANQFVDSVFVPDGRFGPVQLDSAGHRYALPKTCGSTDHSIFAESIGPLAARQRGMPLVASELADHLARALIHAHPLIYLHANAGVTFDLDAIRANRPGRRLARFQAVLSTERSDKPAAKMSAWVFIDGTLCYQKQFSLHDGCFGIDVPLPRGARFLTLVATDAGLDLNSDHVILHCPQLVTESADNG